MSKAIKILGLIGRAVDYSHSPLIHNTAFSLLDLPYYYTVFNIAAPDQIRDALQGARALGMAGFNVTIPYKKTVVPFLDELSEEAASIQAVNTIVNRGGKLIGHNTDIAGFAAPLQPFAASITGSSIALFGSGGAALAAIKAFRELYQPKEILLFVRDPQKARTMLRASGYESGRVPVTVLSQEHPEKTRECRVVVNATPVGTRGGDSGGLQSIVPLDRGLIHERQIVYDMVYNPLDTPLLLAAKRAGATAISGIEMLLGQAARSFSLWTGIEMPVTEVRTVLLQNIQANDMSVS